MNPTIASIIPLMESSSGTPPNCAIIPPITGWRIGCELGIFIKSPNVVSIVTRTGIGLPASISIVFAARMSLDDAPMRISYAPPSTYQSRIALS